MNEQSSQLRGWTRRNFLKVLGVTGASMMFPWLAYAAESDETVKIDIRGADDKSEAVLDEIEDNKGIIVFADEQSGMQSLGTAFSD